MFIRHLRLETCKKVYCLRTTKEYTVCVSTVIHRIMDGRKWKESTLCRILIQKIKLLTCFVLYIFVNLIICVGNIRRSISCSISSMTFLLLNIAADMIRKIICVMRMIFFWFTGAIFCFCFSNFRWRLRPSISATFRWWCWTVVSQMGSWSSI